MGARNKKKASCVEASRVIVDPSFLTHLAVCAKSDQVLPSYGNVNPYSASTFM